MVASHSSLHQSDVATPSRTILLLASFFNQVIGVIRGLGISRLESFAWLIVIGLIDIATNMVCFSFWLQSEGSRSMFILADMVAFIQIPNYSLLKWENSF